MGSRLRTIWWSEERQSACAAAATDWPFSLEGRGKAPVPAPFVADAGVPR